MISAKLNSLFFDPNPTDVVDPPKYRIATRPRGKSTKILPFGSHTANAGKPIREKPGESGRTKKQEVPKTEENENDQQAFQQLWQDDPPDRQQQPAEQDDTKSEGRSEDVAEKPLSSHIGLKTSRGMFLKKRFSGIVGMV